MKNKVIVLGLDGAGFELLDPWLKRGKLPNISTILSKGVYADMQACLPPVTCPNWKCYSTGKNPGKLGMFWWRNFSRNSKKEFFPRSRVNDHDEIWDYLSRKKRKVAVINMPTTYPPKKVNGIQISGGGDAHDIDYVWPPELQESLERDYGYKIHAMKTNSHYYSEQEVFQDVFDVISRKFKVLRDLVSKNEYDFLHLTVFHVNTMQHNYWDSQWTLKIWELIDRNIGDLLKLTNHNSNIMLMSDHGSNEIKVVFNITSWLNANGYLKIKEKKASVVKKMGLNRKLVLSVFNLVKLRPHQVTKYLPKRVRGLFSRLFPNESGEIKNVENYIDWKNTKVLALSQGPIYLLEEKGSTNFLETKKKLKKQLNDLYCDEKGIKIVNKIYEKEEIYSGKHLSEAPDLILDQGKNVHIVGSFNLKNSIFGEPKRWKGENKSTGLFAFYGPDIDNLGKIKNVSILDLAPTLLHLCGCDIPSDLDGIVLKKIFRSSSTASKDPTIRKTMNELKDVKL